MGKLKYANNVTFHLKYLLLCTVTEDMNQTEAGCYVQHKTDVHGNHQVSTQRAPRVRFTDVDKRLKIEAYHQTVVVFVLK